MKKTNGKWNDFAVVFSRGSDLYYALILLLISSIICTQNTHGATVHGPQRHAIGSMHHRFGCSVRSLDMLTWLAGSIDSERANRNN